MQPFYSLSPSPPPLSSTYFELYIHQGASIKNLEASSNGNGHVAAVKLGDGSIVEADTVFFIFHFFYVAITS